jgi:transposase
MQINIGLITDGNGLPFKIMVFKGNDKDNQTVLEQIEIL